MTAVDELQILFKRRLVTSRALETYRGRDWWQLSDAQAEVFGIELEDMPALVLAWELYEAVADIAHNDFHRTELAQALRSELPWVEARTSAPDAWTRFAGLLGIRSGRAFQWFWKYHFEHENTWVVSRPDDDLPMPRPSLYVHDTPRLQPASPSGRDSGDDIPF